MTFLEALKEVNRGKKVTTPDWVDIGMYLFKHEKDKSLCWFSGPEFGNNIEVVEVHNLIAYMQFPSDWFVLEE